MVQLQQQAAAAGQAFADQARLAEAQQNPPEELSDKMNTQKMRPEFSAELADFKLPQFAFTQFFGGLFGGSEAVLLDKANLLGGFQLGKCDSNIDFDSINSSVWTTRSEERRVGKECRSRWSPYH